MSLYYVSVSRFFSFLLKLCKGIAEIIMIINNISRHHSLSPRYNPETTFSQLTSGTAALHIK